MFQDKVVLITGGSSGIGMVTAIKFAENGADIIFTYKTNKSGAREVEEKIQKMGRKVLAVKANLISERAARSLIKKAVKKFEKIDIVVNNAGRYIDGDEWNGSSRIWRKSLGQNLLLVLNVAKYSAELFLKQKSGVMINIASRHGMSGVSDAISYSAAKAGVINLTQTYAKLLAPFAQVNSISPGPVRAGYWLTAPKEELEEQGKLVEPEEVVEKILFLASNKAKDINGQNFLVGHL